MGNLDKSEWPFESRPAPLAPGEVHLWLAALNASPCQISDYAALLSADEQARAARLLSPTDRNRFIAARGFLRTLLGAYAHAAPNALRFQYNPYGKPFLSDETNPHHIQFNLSHSGDWALLAVTHNRFVGVDLEYVATDFDCRPLARRFLSPNERAIFDALPPAEKAEAWFGFWTIKEACAKAVGTGLAMPLDTNLYEVDWAQGKVQSLVPCSGYAAAVAASGAITRLVCRRHYADPEGRPHP